MNGPIVQEEVLEIAREIGLADLTASLGWLDRFRKRHGIVYQQISGEPKSVDESVVENWHSHTVKGALKVYAPGNIFHADKFGLFFNVMPDKTLSFKDETCHGEKLSKERLTILLCANSEGTVKLSPLVIGKSAKLRCFKNAREYSSSYNSSFECKFCRLDKIANFRPNPTKVIF